MGTRAGLWLGTLGALWLVLFSAPFGLYAVERGLAMTSATEMASRLFHPDDRVATGAVYFHMIVGGVVTVLAPLQLLSVVRRRWPALHRAGGYIVAIGAALTALAGFWYIVARGTVGGPVMDVGFGLYGALMLLSVFRAVHLARARDPRHRLWAERLVILVLGSWIYRVHYGLWEIATGGIGSREDFTGPFDLVQVFAFYLPYVLIHAWWWQRRPAAQARLA
jgi:hypothetical protein